MKKVNILYNAKDQLLDQNDINKKIKRMFNGQKIKVKIKRCGSYNLLDKLKSNPNYDFIIIHMGKDGNTYTQAQECRKLSKAILIAESTICPSDKEEILQHFDRYVRPIFLEIGFHTPLERILKEYHFIPKEEWD